MWMYMVEYFIILLWLSCSHADLFEENIEKLKKGLTNYVSENFGPLEVNTWRICEQSGKYFEDCNKEANQQQKYHFFDEQEIIQRFKLQATRNILFMYGGFEDGTLVQYPESQWFSESIDNMSCQCELYDPRFRPWYIETASPKNGRDIFIMVEFSSFTSNVKDLLLRVIKVLLDLVYAKDYIFFQINGQNVDPCTSEWMKASPIVIKKLKNIIEEAEFKSESVKYKDMFKDAYTLLEEKNAKYFYFVGSGKYAERDSGTIIDYITKVSNKCEVKSNMFVVGGNIETDLLTLLKIMDATAKDCPDSYTPDVEVFLNENNNNTIRRTVSNLIHKSYNTVPQVNVHYTLPYNDFIGLGSLIDACKQVFINPDNKKLVGVVCISYLLQEFVGQLSNQKVNKEDTYVFMFDSSGSTYFHPKLQVESKAFSLHITEIETSLLFKDIFKNISSTPWNSNGLSSVYENNQTKTFYWNTVPESGFTIFVVTSEDYVTDINYSNLNNTEKGRILYHRLDLVDGIREQHTFCNMHGQPVMKDSAVFKLSKDSFKEPDYHSTENETTIGDLNEYFQSINPDKYNGGSSFPGQLKNKDEANKLYSNLVPTQNIANRWLNDTSDHNRYTKFRYIAFSSGLIVTVPGIRLHPYYDPRVRPWFIAATKQPDVLHIMPPYLDEFTGAATVSIYKSFNKHSGNLTQVAGVAGLDLSTDYFKHLFMKSMRQSCSPTLHGGCLLVNENGIVIYHDELYKEEKTEDFSYGQETHIIQLEPLLAEELIKIDLMKKQVCFGYNKIKPEQDIRQPYAYYSYILDVRNRTDQTTKDGEAMYSITKLEGFNLYVIYLEKSYAKNKATSSCVCNTVNIKDYNKFRNDNRCIISTEEERSCECPCYVYEDCNVETVKNKDLIPVCSPITFEDKTIPYKNNWNVGMFPDMNNCLDLKCKNETTNEGCERPGCEWCFGKSCPSTKLLSDTEKRCVDESKCCPAITAQPPTRQYVTKSDNDKKGAWIALYVLIPISIIIFLGLTVLFLFHKRHVRFPHRNATKRQFHENHAYQTEEVETASIKDGINPIKC